MTSGSQHQSHLPQVRQAELRVRPTGSFRSRAALAVEPLGGRQDAHSPAGTGRDGEGPRELAAYKQLVEVNETICEVRPVPPSAEHSPAGSDGERGSARRSPRRPRPR